MNLIKKLIFFLIIYKIYLPAQITDSKLRFQHLTVKDGLPGKTIHKIAQDKKGFLWLSTSKGICKYDGYKFKTYILSSTSSEDLFINLYIDKEGDIWAGGFNSKLYKFKSNRDRFFEYPHFIQPEGKRNFSIIDFTCNRKSELWLATKKQGILKLNKTSGSLKHYKSSLLKIKDRNVTTIYAGSRQFIWIGTEEGVVVALDTQSETVHDYDFNKMFPIPFKYRISEIRETSEKGLIVGTNSGAFVYDKIKNRFEPLLIMGKNYFKKLSVSTIFEDKRRDLWIASDSGILKIYNIDEKIEQTQYSKNSLSCFSSDVVKDIFEDSSGLIWIATTEGLNKLPNCEVRFNEINSSKDDRGKTNYKFVTAFYKSSNSKTLWVGTDCGLYRTNDLSKGLKKLEFPGSPGSGDFNITAITDYNHQQLLLATFKNGVFFLNKRDGQFIKLRSIPDQNFYISCFLRSRENKVLIGTNRGLTIFNKKRTNRFLLPEYQITTLLQDRQGSLWIGTDKGLIKLQITKGQSIFKIEPQHFKKVMSRGTVTTLFEDNSGGIWIGTHVAGLYRYDSRQDKLVKYKTDYNSTDIPIMSIEEDFYKRLWIARNDGLVLLDREKESIKTFFYKDGLPEISPIPSVALKINSNTICFGGHGGFYYFNSPSRLNNNWRNTPQIQITDTSFVSRGISKNFIPAGGKEIALRLSYKQTFINLEFAVMDFKDPAKNIFSYKIGNENSSWTPPTQSNQINFGNLEPGNHTIDVKGANSNGVWTKKKIRIKINVIPPFWNTLWFRISLLAATVFISSMFYFFIYKRIKKQKKSSDLIKREAFFKKKRISMREREIILLIIQGLSNREIEERLFISIGTVKNHIYSIYQKLNINSRTQLIAIIRKFE